MSFSTLAPALLLAAPRLGDPNFERTVVLLGRHTPEGALGWIINGAQLPPVGELLRASGLVPADQVLPASDSFRRPARLGGPVAPQTGWLVYRRDRAHFDGAIAVGPELEVTGDQAALAAVIAGDEPQEFRMLLGYAGWDAGQLEEELRGGSWLPTAVDGGLLFGANRTSDALWSEAFRQATGADPQRFGGPHWGSA